MRALNFAKRNFKELIRDPLSIVFSVLLPLVLLLVFSVIKIPSDNYRLPNFTPGIVIFGFSFITLFTAMLVSKDRTSSLLIRLGISPMKPLEYILGYVLCILPMIVIQNILFFLLAVILGLEFSVHILLAMLVSVAIAPLFIAFGIIIGSFCSEKAASGIGSIIVQLVCFTSGMYFPREMLGKVFARVCEVLPFESCVTILRGVMNNDVQSISARNVIVFLLYTLIALAAAVWVFRRQMMKGTT